MGRLATQLTTESHTCEQLGHAFISEILALCEKRSLQYDTDEAKTKVLTNAALNVRYAVLLFLELATRDN